MTAWSTRLLVLGAVRFMQPTYGYDVRRELISWGVEDWANIKPASIYSALRTLSKDGLIEVTATERNLGRPERTAYVMTGEGEKEFQALLRNAWWTVQPLIEPLLPALTMFTSMTRAELMAALKGRIVQLEAQVAKAHFIQTAIKPGDTGAEGGIPEHVRESFFLTMGRAQAEITWAHAFLGRLEAGDYVLLGEVRPEGDQ